MGVNCLDLVVTIGKAYVLLKMISSFCRPLYVCLCVCLSPLYRPQFLKQNVQLPLLITYDWNPIVFGRTGWRVWPLEVKVQKLKCLIYPKPIKIGPYLYYRPKATWPIILHHDPESSNWRSLTILCGNHNLWVDNTFWG